MCPLMLDCVNKGIMTLQHFVNLLCINPAKLFGVESRGHIEPGRQATLTLLDMGKKTTISPEWLGTHAQLSPLRE